MEQIISNTTTVSKTKNFTKFKTNFNKYFFQPMLSAIMGFLLFLTIIILVKFLSYSFGFQKALDFDVYDIYLSGLGFFLAYLIRFIDNVKPTN